MPGSITAHVPFVDGCKTAAELQVANTIVALISRSAQRDYVCTGISAARTGEAVVRTPTIALTSGVVTDFG
jgi:hypothetical protein